jgi:hypothetical protein
MRPPFKHLPAQVGNRVGNLSTPAIKARQLLVSNFPAPVRAAQAAILDKQIRLRLRLRSLRPRRHRCNIREILGIFLS